MGQQRYVGMATKDPIERLDYTEKWGDVLNPINDRIKRLEWVLTLAGTDTPATDAHISGAQNGDFDSTLTVAGGSVGTNYALSHIIHTVDGRIFKRSVLIRCIRK